MSLEEQKWPKKDKVTIIFPKKKHINIGNTLCYAITTEVPTVFVEMRIENIKIAQIVKTAEVISDQ
jgi:hypothetical protein